MVTILLWLNLFVFAFACTAYPQSASVAAIHVNDPTSYGYTLMSEMRPSADLVGLEFKDQVWSKVHSYMLTYGWDYSEHPNSSNRDHDTKAHIAVEWDTELQQHVFNLFSHCNEDALDGDRGSKVDRMRNEMKSRTGPAWYKMNGNYNEWQVLEWKMKIPVGYQPTQQFCHIHQLKAQEGDDNGAPVITISLRANDSEGNGRRLQVIHTARRGGNSAGVFIDDPSLYSLDKFEGQWLQVQQEVNFQRNGYYRLRISRVSDGVVLLDQEKEGIDLWRAKGAVNIRNKFGIYRSYGGKMTNAGDRPVNGLKDENIWLADFKVYKKNTNNNPQAIDD